MAFHLLAVDIQYQRRNANDFLLRRQFTLVININAPNFQLSGIFLFELIEYRVHHFARHTPIGPKINQHRHRSLQCFRFKIIFGHFNSHTNLPGIPMLIRKPATVKPFRLHLLADRLPFG